MNGKMADTARIHGIAYNTTALGPGNRAVIWFQGCKRSCKGCMSPGSRPLDGGTVWKVDDLLEKICSLNNIEGITISGGEPFLQVEALYMFLKNLRLKTDLGVIIYTGNTIEELKQMRDPMVDEIITDLADIIIDGEYIDELNDDCALKGSSNQVVNYISNRYKEYKNLYDRKDRSVQIVIEGKDALFIGVPTKETLSTWSKIVKEMK